MRNSLFTNGVIAVKERALLGEKLLRLAEMSFGEALSALSESGFGGGAREPEEMAVFEERALDDFIRVYAPSRPIRDYFLLPRDFHNAKALVKARLLSLDETKLLAPEGTIPVEELKEAVRGERETLPALREAIESCEKEGTGAEIGACFDRALFACLRANCRGVLRELLAGRADRLNLLTVFRTADRDGIEKFFVPGGKYRAEELVSAADPDGKFAEKVKGSSLETFYTLLLSAREKGEPFTAAERELDSFETTYFYARRYELEAKEPFLYYVFRRRAEIANVRVVLVCLNAGLKEDAIKRRLRNLF